MEIDGFEFESKKDYRMEIHNLRKKDLGREMRINKIYKVN